MLLVSQNKIPLFPLRNRHREHNFPLEVADFLFAYRVAVRAILGPFGLRRFGAGWYTPPRQAGGWASRLQENEPDRFCFSILFPRFRKRRRARNYHIPPSTKQHVTRKTRLQRVLSNVLFRGVVTPGLGMKKAAPFC